MIKSDFALKFVPFVLFIDSHLYYSTLLILLNSSYFTWLIWAIIKEIQLAVHFSAAIKTSFIFAYFT